ncbi:MAG: hypothetical protein EA343_15800 [Nodularia sp. (in: Bacteria)]|nr:MAG: hypothetical protein EA343_15800 [Nodularia sp. (in: cyanobacteria)]
MLLQNQIMKKEMLAKFGLFLTLAFVSILTGCDTNSQSEQTPPISDTPTEASQPVSDASTEASQPVSDASTEQSPPVSDTPTEQSPPVSDTPTEQTLPVSDPPDCEDYCQKLPTDTSLSKLSIQPEAFANLPKWNSICEATNQDIFCTVLKPYEFANGIVYLKASSTEYFITDIHLTSSINQDTAMSIAKAALNSQQPFEKTEKTSDKIILRSNPFERGENDIDHLEVTHLKLNSQNQVTQITSYATSP